MNNFVAAELVKETAELVSQPVDEVAPASQLKESLEQRKLQPLRTRKLSEVQAKEVDWLWKPFIARGTFTLISGEEGIGKTFATCAICAAIGGGYSLPRQHISETLPASPVVLASAEDSLDYVLKPRLDAMRANCEQIIAIDELFTFDRDGVLRLELVLAEIMPVLLVIDPIFSYTGKTNINQDSDIRLIGNEILRLAEKYHCAIVAIRHIGKSKGLGDARAAGLGGIGWRASCRSELLIGKNPDNDYEKAICQIKNNLAPIADFSIGFEIKDGEFFWKESKLTADQILSSFKNSEEKNSKADAVNFLEEMFKNEAPVMNQKRIPSDDVNKAAKRLGITDYSLRQAKQQLSVKSVSEGYGENKVWFLVLGVEDGA